MPRMLQLCSAGVRAPAEKMRLFSQRLQYREVEIRMSKFLKRSAQGAGVPHEKRTSNLETVAMPLPSKIVLSMGQHIGAPASPAVAKGDQVYVGTIVGKSGGFVSSDIHSGVSGTVSEITTITAPNGATQTAVVIVPDGEQKVDPAIAPPEVTDYKSFVDAIRASGLVGLGGAGFPTAVKLSPKNLDEIDTLLINGAECEPYITSDNRCFLEDTHHVLGGIKAVMKYLNIPKCIIGIEGNKPEAIAKMKAAIDAPGIEVKELPCRYPQGAEKVLIENCTGRSGCSGSFSAGGPASQRRPEPRCCSSGWAGTGRPHRYPSWGRRTAPCPAGRSGRRRSPAAPGWGCR